MMKPIITKTGMVLAVAATAALPNLAAAADGWDYSGAHARASALQLDYFSLDGDIGNIWVNPALVKQYSNTMELSITDDDRQDINRADDNVGRSGAGTTNGGVAGILHGLNDSTTVGAYIGRDRADMSGYDIADGLNDSDLGTPGTAENPQNQFDIFFATGLGEMDMGVRFNYQAKEESTSGPRNVSVSGSGSSANQSNTTAATIVAQLIDDNDADQSVVPTPTLDLVAEMGNYTETATSSSSGWDATEMNITLGLNLFDGLDGSLQLGSADGTLYTNSSSVSETFEYTGTAGSEVLTQVGSNVSRTKDAVSVDSGQSMALALRYQATDNWLTSFAYSSFDYGGSLVRSTITNDVDMDPDGNGLVEGNNTVTTIDSDVETGSSVREGTVMALNAAYQIQANEKGKVIIATGLVMEDLENGYSLNQARDNTEVSDLAAVPVTTTTFNSATGTNDKFMQEVSSTSIPLTIALEQALSDKWERWTVRGSVSKNIYESTEVKSTDYYFTTSAIEFDADGIAINGGRSVQQFSETTTDKEVWADRETTVRLGFGYTRGDFTVDTVLSATVDRLFTADHKILEDSKFGKVTVAYKY
jgi:hypothetical protein